MFRFRGLFGRLLGLYILIVVSTLGLLSMLLSHLLQDYFFSAKQQELVTRGAVVAGLAGPLFGPPAGHRDARLRLTMAGRFLTGGAFIIDRQNRVVDALGREPAEGVRGQMPCRITEQLPKLLDVMSGRIVTAIGYNPAFDESAFFAAVPVTRGGAIVGAVIMHSPVLGLRNTIAHVRLLVFGLALAAVALSAALGFFLTRSVTAPLRRMSHLAGLMAAGDFQSRVPETGTDEIAHLAGALNRMSTSLHDTIQSLSEEQSKLAQIVATMREGVVAVDGEGSTVMVNAQAQALLAQQEPLLAGHPLPEGALAEAFRQAIAEEREETVSFPGSDGGRVLQAHISPTAVEGSTVGAVGIVRDVTELHRVEQMRRQFVADASHQLRAPLTTIQAHAEALLDEVAPDGAARDRYLAAIVRDCRRLGQLIAQLLDLSRLESGQARLARQPLALPALLRHVVDSIAHTEDQPELVVEAADELPLALADESCTEQALLNLIANALRHTPPAGRVTVWARVESDHLLIGVTDTGAGIAAEHLPRIWDRFYRAGETGKDGTGLGLAIVRSLAECQGGQVSAQSCPGEGSTFTFTLPFAPH